MLQNDDYWRAVAGGIDAEDTKARLFLEHHESLGTAREMILRDLLVKFTPEPYRISRGFVFQEQPEFWTSKQCDLLVYDPTVSQPGYAIGSLVVVPRRATKLVAEVKTRLGKKELDDALAVHESVGWLPAPTMTFAFDGVCFETFIKHLTNAVRERPAGVPNCIAVHTQNYLFIRSNYTMPPHTPPTQRHRPAASQFAVDFSSSGQKGRASGAFFNFYLHLLRGSDVDMRLKDWFAGLELPDDAKVRISDMGDVRDVPA